MQKLFWLAALITYIAMGSIAHARPLTPNDVEVISNSLNYINGLTKQGKNVVIGLVYDASIAGSEADAKKNQEQIASSGAARKAGLSAELIPLDALAGKNNLGIVYIPEELATKSAQIYQTAKEKHIFTLGNSRQCVSEKCCILSIRADPVVEILINESTLRDLGFDIDATYRLMVKRV